MIDSNWEWKKRRSELPWRQSQSGTTVPSLFPPETATKGGRGGALKCFMHLLPLFLLSLSKLLHSLHLLLQHSAQRNVQLSNIFDFWNKSKTTEDFGEALHNCRFQTEGATVFAHVISFHQTMLSGSWNKQKKTTRGSLLERFCGSKCRACFLFRRI